jgi:hypothetical protein
MILIERIRLLVREIRGVRKKQSVFIGTIRVFRIVDKGSMFWRPLDEPELREWPRRMKRLMIVCS